MSKANNFLMGYEIKTAPGPVLKPVSFKVWDQNSKFSEFTPHAPLKFMNDTLVGLQFHRLANFEKPHPTHEMFLHHAVSAFCPYAALFKSSNIRLKSFLNSTSPADAKGVLDFEKEWFGFWKDQDLKSGINFNKLDQVFDLIHTFETKINSPLMYNLSIQFSEKFNQHLLSMYSFLFHLRSLIALDHNAHIDDSSFQSVKCDSISDYLPRADFTTNDALVYLNFKKLTTPFVDHKDKDVRIEKLLVHPLQKIFEQFNHNACLLIENLPKDYYGKKTTADLEEDLHQFQMDWLLGTSSGLLFRIREELYGLHHGYEKIFWPEAVNHKIQKPTQLKVCFELSEADLNKEIAA